MSRVSSFAKFRPRKKRCIVSAVMAADVVPRGRDAAVVSMILALNVADGGGVSISFADVAGSPSHRMKVHVLDPRSESPGEPTFYEHLVDVGILLCEPL